MIAYSYFLNIIRFAFESLVFDSLLIKNMNQYLEINCQEIAVSK